MARQMSFRNSLAKTRLSNSRIMGLAMAIAGIVLLLMAYDAQSGIDEIGATNDPVLQDKVTQLQSERNVCLVSGVGALFLGLFAIGLLVEPSTSITIPEAEMISSARTANQILAGLSIAGNASYLPAKHGLTRERVMVSAKEGVAVPPVALSDDMALSPGKDGSTPGIIFEPFGLELLNKVEKELGTRIDGAGIETVEGALQILKHGFGIMRDFHFKERDGKIILRVEYSGLLDACRTVRKEKPDTCRQLECLACSCLLTAAARSTGKVISVEEVDNDKDTVVFTLSTREW